jgi:hypothetical protein
MMNVGFIQNGNNVKTVHKNNNYLNVIIGVIFLSLGPFSIVPNYGVFNYGFQTEINPRINVFLSQQTTWAISLYGVFITAFQTERNQRLTSSSLNNPLGLFLIRMHPPVDEQRLKRKEEQRERRRREKK